MKETTYWIEGLSCGNCAKKFEKNVSELPQVSAAQVNFGAGKILVTGEASIAEIEQAGAFDKIKVYESRIQSTDKDTETSFFQTNYRLILSAILILCAFTANISLGKDSLVTILFYILAIMIGGFSLFKEGLSDLAKGDFTMQALMSIAITGAALIGEWTEGAVVVLLFALSETLETYAMAKSRESIRSLMDIIPKNALVKCGDREIEMAVDEVNIGDILLIKPAQKIPMDGVVVGGHSYVNQAAITGESALAEKKIQDEVFAGTLNDEGILEVEVTKLIEDMTISKIIHLVEEAQVEKAPAQAFVDKFAKYYTPAILLLSALVMLIPPLFLGGDWHLWIYQGLSLLVVGCPCSLIISTPVSIVSAIGSSAKQGVLVKGGIYLEELGRIKSVAFDKTGTLTKGEPVVTDFLVNDQGKRSDYLAIISAVEHLSQHPLATAIIKYADHEKVACQHVQVENFTSVTGKGVKGVIGGTTYLVGSSKLFSREAVSKSEFLKDYKIYQTQGKTAMFFGINTQILGVIAVADALRDSSSKVIHELHDLGIEHTIMLTGDNIKTAEFIGSQLGISDIKADLMPQDKLSYVKELQKEYGKVAMIGDGINDAPSLATADVGIAMGAAGTDVALETADIALMGDDLEKLPFLIKLSRKTLRIIKQNITFSLSIKLLALLLIIPGWLTLWIAIVADMGATLLVTMNSLRLMKN